MLYGVREADDTLFWVQDNALGQWLSNEVEPYYPGRPELRQAERLLQQLLSIDLELTAQYRQGQIDEARRSLSRIDRVGEELVNVLQPQETTQAPVLTGTAHSHRPAQATN